MQRWLALFIIVLVVVSGINGCVLVVADENVAQEIRTEYNRSQLARDIAREIDRDEHLSYSDISVSEEGSVVTLRGTVDSIGALQRAIDIAVRYEDVSELQLRVALQLHK